MNPVEIPEESLSLAVIGFQGDHSLDGVVLLSDAPYSRAAVECSIAINGVMHVVAVSPTPVVVHHMETLEGARADDSTANGG
ncbi:hypothetical protein V6N13_122313 [Hibiscus sabdariffa]|uniref:Uncharacterized protein n=1 Tax=Hibiscus sabdariffa TaxID=183260 RepID=A0ABR2Q7P6_9ROSI